VEDMAVNLIGQTGENAQGKREREDLDYCPDEIYMAERMEKTDELHKQVERAGEKEENPKKLAWNLPRPLSALPPV
jgi:hypothetical protein